MTEIQNDAVAFGIGGEEYAQFVTLTNEVLLQTIQNNDPRYATLIVLAMMETAINASVDAVGHGSVLEILYDLSTQISADFDSAGETDE